MQIHKNLCLAIVDGLLQTFNEENYADKVLPYLLKRDKRWGSRDRSFIAETFYDIVRYKRLYAKIANVKQPFSRDDLWRLLAVWLTLKGIRLPSWKYFENTPTRKIKGKFDELSKIRLYRESIPDWLDKLALKELGESIWTKEIKALNQPANVVLRVNTLKTTKALLQDHLFKEAIETEIIKEYEDALQLKTRKNVFITQAFKNGLFEVQDASSQRVAPFLQVKLGMKVVDACAGAGGKTLHLASLMENKGQIIAMDVLESKLKKLKLRAKRNGVHNIQYRPIHSNKDIKKHYEKADRLLIDAPCSGLGVLKRRPDDKWKLNPDFISQLQTKQQAILQQYSKLVKPQGLMVYATCSILPSENELQIEKFLTSKSGKNFIFVKENKILAHKSGFDGFYMALLKHN